MKGEKGDKGYPGRKGDRGRQGHPGDPGSPGKKEHTVTLRSSLSNLSLPFLVCTCVQVDGTVWFLRESVNVE